MKEKNVARTLWSHVLEDNNLVFFFLGFVAWLVDFIVGFAGPGSFSWPRTAVRLAVPVLFIIGIVFYVRKHMALTKQILSTKHLPVVFVVGKPWDDASATLNSAQETVARLTGFKVFRQLEGHFNVRREYLVAHSKERLPPMMAQWKDFIEDAEGNIRRFADAVSGEKVYHLFIYGPASLALGVGSAFGCKHKLVAYQLSDGEYKPVINLLQDIRRIKQGIAPHRYSYIKVSYPEVFTPDVAVALDMAAHPASGDAKSYIKQHNPGWNMVEVTNTYQGNLTEEDWVKVVQEVYSVFRNIQGREEVDRLHLFHSMPVALAFGLGVALGNFVPVTVYNWEAAEAKYYPVLKLNELESFL